MNDTQFQDIPKRYSDIQFKSDAMGFNMPSDMYMGSLLKTLVSSKPNGLFLELGTGTGLSLSWMLDGMDQGSRMVTIDNDENLVDMVKGYFGDKDNLTIVMADAGEWIETYKGQKFDLIFADAWPGKYSHIDEVMDLLNVGGFYVLDDMDTQPNWPEGHQDKVDALLTYLENRKDLNLTKMNWSTGVLIATKKE